MPHPNHPILLGSTGCGSLVVGLGIALVAGFAVWGAGFPEGIIPGLFALAGLAFAGYRWRSELLRAEGRIDEHHHLFIFSWTSSKQIGILQRLLIGRPETRGSGKNRRTVYPVKLEGATAEHELAAPQSVLAARRLGEEWAKRLELPIADSSSGNESVRAYEELDQPVIERIASGDLAVPPPAQLRTTLREADGRIEIIQRFAPGRAILIGVLILIATIIASFAILAVVPGSLAGILVAALVVGDVVGFAALVAVGAFRDRLVVTPRVGLRLRGAAIEANQLEELVVGDGPPRLRAISDRTVIEFGRGLPPAELAYLRAVILSALRGR